MIETLPFLVLGVIIGIAVGSIINDLMHDHYDRLE